jgi:hypothetical protein
MKSADDQETKISNQERESAKIMEVSEPEESEEDSFDYDNDILDKENDIP